MSRVSFQHMFRDQLCTVDATVQPAERDVGIMGSWLDEYEITLPDGTKFAGEPTDAEFEELQEAACALYDEGDGDYDPEVDDE